jgi:hypothetical protein
VSVRENIELYGLADEEEFVKVLSSELSAAKHPNQADSYMLEGLSFHALKPADDHLSILGFNIAPLHDSLIEAWVDHTELFPNDILIRWTQGQDLIFEVILGQQKGWAVGR